MAKRQGLWDMRGKLIKFSAYIPGFLYDKLKKRAKRENKTISFLLAEILEKELKRDG